MFLQRCDISTVWDKFPINFTHTHTDYQSTSVIDHFLCNEGLLPYISDAGALYLGDNLSRHSPILLRLNVGQIATKVQAEPVQRPKRPAWYKATKQQISDYTVLLSDKLDQLEIPASLKCQDVTCTSHDHKTERDNLMIDLIGSICDAGRESLPQTGGRPPENKNQPDSINKALPGWKEHVAPFRDKAVFWYSVWQSAGRPPGGELHNLVKKTRSQYHYAIRRIKRFADSIRSNKLAEAAFSGNANLLQEMKRVKSAGCQTEPDNVDGSTSVDIPEQFANVYQQLFNSVDDKVGLEQLQQSFTEAGINAKDVAK